MNNTEKKLSKSNNRKTYKGKLKNYGYSLMLISALWLNGCGSHNLDVKKAAEKYQDAIENIQDKKEHLKKEQDALKKAEKYVKEAEKELIEAEKAAEEAKEELKNESEKL